MGYDKADLAFCIHVGSPSSPVAMYQQVGRAGRAIDDAVAVLLPAETDERLWEYFATVGIPDPELADRVLGPLDGRPGDRCPALEQATGARRGRIEALLRVLAVDGAVDPRRRAAGRRPDSRGRSTRAKYATLRAGRDAEAELMRAYARKQRCLMMLLQEALDDPDPTPCGRCGVCTGRPVVGRRPPTTPRSRQARDWMRDAADA